MRTKCRPGDLAVIVTADMPRNLGRIVRVLQLHDGSGDIVWDIPGPVWVVHCASTLTWKVEGKRVRRRTGPVPDARLQPIRGQQPARKSAQRRKDAALVVR